MDFQVRSIEEFRSSQRYGVVITNPPYGERLMERTEAEHLYKAMGRVLSPLNTWSSYVLTSHPAFEKLFGQSVVRKRKLYNGMIQCHYYQFPGPAPTTR